MGLRNHDFERNQLGWYRYDSVLAFVWVTVNQLYNQRVDVCKLKLRMFDFYQKFLLSSRPHLFEHLSSWELHDIIIQLASEGKIYLGLNPKIKYFRALLNRSWCTNQETWGSIRFTFDLLAFWIIFRSRPFLRKNFQDTMQNIIITLS